MRTNIFPATVLVFGWIAGGSGLCPAWAQSSVTASSDEITTNGGIALRGAGTARHGAIVGWGSQVVADLTGPFVSIAAGANHSLGLKADGSIIAWGCAFPNNSLQCNVPAPNSGFVAIAAGHYHNLGLRALRADLDLDGVVGFSDHADIVDCLAGPGVLPSFGCGLAKLNGDWSIDLADYAVFQARFGDACP